MLFPQRALATAFAAAALLAVPTAQAQAAPTYPPSGNSITVSTTSPAVGETVMVSAKTFKVGSDVDVDVEVVGDEAASSLRAPGASTGTGRVGTAFVPLAASGSCVTSPRCTVVADSAGVATASVKLTSAGTANISFGGVDAAGQPLTQTVEITTAGGASAEDPAAPVPANEGLASTGAGGFLETLAVGLGLLGIGTALVLMVRKRRDAAYTAI